MWNCFGSLPFERKLSIWLHSWGANLKSEHAFDALFSELLLKTVLEAKNTQLYIQTRWRSELPEGPYYRHLKESASHHVFAFAQLRGEGTQIDPHGLRRKPKMPKIINLSNCVKLPFSISFWRFWLAFWDLRLFLRSLKCVWKWLIRISKTFYCASTAKFQMNVSIHVKS